MAGNYKRRKRKIDVEKMTNEQVERLGVELGKKIADIMDEANYKCSKLLDIYGLETKISYSLVKKKKTSKKPKKEQSL